MSQISTFVSPTKTPHGNKLFHEVESLLLDEIAARLGVIAHHDALAKSVTTFMSRGAKVYVSNDNLSVSHQDDRSDVQIGHVEGVFLDELATRFDVVAHQDSEDFIGGGGIVHADLKK